MKNVKNKDLNTRHGSLLGIGEIIAVIPMDSLHSELKDMNLYNLISEAVLEYPQIYLDSFGSDLNREGLCKYIGNCCRVSWPATQTVQEVWLHLLETSLDRKDETLQTAAALAIGQFSRSYPLQESVIQRFIDTTATSHGLGSRRGYALVLGELSRDILDYKLQDLIQSLSKAVHLLNNPNLDDAELRRNAISSMCKLVQRCHGEDSIGTSFIFHIFHF